MQGMQGVDSGWERHFDLFSTFLLTYWIIMSFVLIFVYFIICWGLFRILVIKRKWPVLRAEHCTVFLGLLLVFPLNAFVLGFLRSPGDLRFIVDPLVGQLSSRAILTLILLCFANFVFWMLYELGRKK